jgi:hypothetical protein
MPPPFQGAWLLVYAIKYEAPLCSLQCGGCGRCLTCDGLCQPPTDARRASRSYCWVLPLLSPAPWWSVRTTARQHGARRGCVTHAGDSSEVGQREHMVRLGIHRKCWSKFLCLGGYLALLRQVGGGRSPRDALGRHPSADPCRWHLAGGPVAGAQQLGIESLDAKRLWHHAGNRLVSEI